MRRLVLVADLFCGAGGSSTGARRALATLGLRMQLVAVNHWPTAVATHALNHPDARHLCVDVYKTQPLEAVPGGRLDLLMASPTCTYFSRARGGKPVSHEQRFGRMTPTQVIRWVTDLDVRCLLVENVPEFRDWGPLDRKTQKPIKAKRGVYFRAWVRKLERLGYRVEWRILTAADYGDATTRSRFFLLARKDGLPLCWPEPTHNRDGSGGLKRWRPAREVIDWSITGRSIFDRQLSRKTLERVLAGAIKFGWHPTLVGMIREHIATGRDPRPSAPAAQDLPAGGMPFMLSRHAGGAPRGVDEPTPTQVAKHSHLLVFYYGNGSSSPVDAPIPTVTTRDRFALVTPAQPFMPAAFGERAGQAPRVHSIDEPAPTICAQGRLPLVEARGWDVLLRMLQPSELAGAMSFIDDEAGYEFVGTKTEQVRQIGNAVPVRTAAALVGALLADVAAEEAAA